MGLTIPCCLATFASRPPGAVSEARAPRHGRAPASRERRGSACEDRNRGRQRPRPGHGIPARLRRQSVGQPLPPGRLRAGRPRGPRWGCCECPTRVPQGRAAAGGAAASPRTRCGSGPPARSWPQIPTCTESSRSPQNALSASLSHLRRPLLSCRFRASPGGSRPASATENGVSEGHRGPPPPATTPHAVTNKIQKNFSKLTFCEGASQIRE